MLNKYEKYLETLDLYLARFFDEQKSYIFCQKGCSKCCESGMYPLSELEFKYLLKGIDKLNKETKAIIKKEFKKINKSEKYYKCPFLINNVCLVYKFRPLICRSYGLLLHELDKDGIQRYRVPMCAVLGLNYSSVYDENLCLISRKKWEKLNIEVEPVAYNVERKFLMESELSEGINFGESQNLLDWLNKIKFQFY